MCRAEANSDDLSLRVTVLGIPVWIPSRDCLVRAIAEQLQTRTVDTCPYRLFTLNPELLLLSVKHEYYRKVLASGEWNIVDGVGLAIAIRLRAPGLLRRRLAGLELRHPGSDLVYDLADATRRSRRPLFLIGGKPERLRKACGRLSLSYPGLRVEGFSPGYTPSLPLLEQAELESRLLAIRPATVLVCLGAPKQELWISQSMECLRKADVRIAAGLGGTIDFLSGEVPRAPSILRRIGAEWLYRLAIEPSRWRRQSRSLPEFTIRALFAPRFVAVTKR